MLVLNTKKKIKLKPRKLFIEADCLYQSEGDERIKFTDRGLLKISDLIEFKNGGYFINVKNRKYKIREV
jgi:hypothetical protein